MNITEKILHFTWILFIASVITALGNLMDGKHVLGPSMVGVFVIAGIALAGAVLSYLPGFNRFPMVFWVSLVGVIVSIPGVPGSAWIVKQASEVTFLACTTPVLAYAGLSLGNDLDAFRKLSWRIIPVGIAVVTGTFLCATIVAQIVLHLEGTI